ncbi:helix-turn-helix domain-containing protein [Actinoplanes sp. CA-015351]|uniref:helix-turn-helix domain-containing protein n=1 Tax=Actinoplanes sp. CA-015351 TaxID=3239897 RepID=UPI003D951079
MTGLPGPDDRPVELVGSVLARWRKRRKLTGQELGDLVGMSQAKISRLENGKVLAEPGDVRAIAEALNLPDEERERVVERAEHADDRLTEWTPAGRDLADRQKEYGRMEATAKELRIMQPAVVPGLLQTSEYARALLADLKDEVDDLRSADSAVSEAVNARMQRNQILHEQGREFHFLITEQVLRNQVCQPAEMISQISRMREVAAQPNVRLRIVADDAVLPIAPYHGFVVADDRWVSVDLFSASLRSAGRQAVRTYRRIFDALEQVALTDVSDLLDRYHARYVAMLMPKSVVR